MVFADALLARRMEAAEAANARGCSPRGASVLEVAGGCAIFTGADSPLTHAVGIGLNGPVSEAEISAIETFFRSRGAKVAIDLCPLADPGLFQALGQRGYHLTEFNNVLVKPLVPFQLVPRDCSSAAAPAGLTGPMNADWARLVGTALAGSEIVLTPRVRRAVPGEDDLWSYTVGRGFFDQPELTTEEMEVGRAIFAMPGAMCYLGVAGTGATAAGAALAIRDGLATLFADSTIAQFRCQGLHREIIAARLNEAIAQRCDMATASTLPGSVSQRNYERAGFEVVYTKVTLVG